MARGGVRRADAPVGRRADSPRETPLPGGPSESKAEAKNNRSRNTTQRPWEWRVGESSREEEAASRKRQRLGLFAGAAWWHSGTVWCHKQPSTVSPLSLCRHLDIYAVYPAVCSVSRLAAGTKVLIARGGEESRRASRAARRLTTREAEVETLHTDYGSGGWAKATEKRRPRAGSGGGWGCLPVLCGVTVARCGVTNNLPPSPPCLSADT